MAQRKRPNVKLRSLSSMVIALAIVLGLISSQVALAATLAAPVQTYYVPLSEDDLFATFDTINSDAGGNVNTVISVAIAADGTLVYYDHWEDGYDPAPNDTVNKQASTEIWGDGDLTNGVAPGIPGDVLSGGDAIVLDNPIPPTNNYRDPSTILYDGADRVQATLPIAVTRFAFPDAPGSLMAGAVEVFNQDSWGNRFVAPVGEDTADLSGTDPFEYSVFYVMAGDDGTELFLNGSSLGVINTGDNFVVEDLQQGDELTSNRPVQVDLVTGDIGDTYELRWYAQVDADEWSNEYITPVAEETGSTGYWFYNPNGAQITIAYEGANSPSGSFNVAANSSTFIEVDSGGDIDLSGDDYSGLRFSSASTFYGLAQIDADGGGQIYDWGFPLIPTDQLTSQVLVGLGRGATDDGIPLNNQGEQTRSVVWVTPVEDSIIFIDFDGDGVFDDKVAVDALDSLRIVDDTDSFPGAENDQDLTGAIIVSNTADANDDLVPDGNAVNIAVVWGQDPPRSLSGDSEALDLGTLVVPLAVPFINKEATGVTNPDNTPDSDGIVDEAGDVINYIITVSNVGFQDLTSADLTDPLLEGANGTLNGPIESKNPDGILERGETWIYTGSYTVQPSDVINNGTLEPNNVDPGFIDNTATVDTDQSDPVSDTEQVPLELHPAVEIQKTVYGGHDGGASCPGGELASGANGAAVTYCFEVINTGNTYISDIEVNDPDLGGTVGTISGPLAPGASDSSLFVESTIDGDLVNTATASGNPTYPDGSDLPDEEDVTGEDTAEVEEVPDADLRLNKTVNNTTPNVGDNVVFTIVVTNDGPADATGVSVSDQLPSGYSYVSDDGAGAYVAPIWTIGDLANGASATLNITVEVLASGDTENYAQVATSDQPDPDSTPGNDSTTEDDDDTADTTPNPIADLRLNKSVSDSTPNVGDNVIFTIVVTNDGPSDATGVSVSDQLPSGYSYVSDDGAGAYVAPIWTIGDLANGASATLNITVEVLASGDTENYAQVATSDQDDPDSTPGDDSTTDDDDDTVNTTPNPVADLRLNKSVSDSTPNVGDNVIFTIVVTNDGPSDATGVSVSDQLPSGYSYVSDDGAGAYVAPIWTIGDLANGASATLNITVEVLASGDTENYAQVATSDQDDPDSTPGNDSTTEDDDDTTDVNPAAVADLAIDKSDDGSNAVAGQTYTYTLEVTNNGPSDSSGSTVSDVLPAGWAFVSSSIATCAGDGLDPETVTCAVGPLSNGTSTSFTLTVAVPADAPSGTVINSASVDGNEPDPDPTNDEDNEPTDVLGEGSVSGHLYIDTNGNGTQDAGEPDLANVDVIVTDSAGNTQTVSTDTDGNWTADVPPGTTTADVDETDPDYPTGYTQTEGDDPTTVTAISEQDVSAGNDGYYLPGTVSGHLYLDTNGNGVQDAGEPDLANVDVIVTDSAGNTQTVTSDANGDWDASVPPGTTTADVDETDPDYPAGYTQTEGDDPTTVSAVAGTNTDAGNDGYHLPGTVSGHLYIDTNGNGAQDIGEPDLANVDVIVTDSNGNTQTVSSDANGDWSANVPPGTTTADVDENDPEYPVNHTQTEGDDPTTVTAVAGTNTDAGIDGYAPPAGTVSGHLYIDTNGNGTQDAGEPDLADVDVIVTDSAGNIQTVTTDADGNWTATVPPGTTTADVDENDPEYPTGYTQTEGDDPTTVTAVSDADTDGGIDGYAPPPGTVSGHLYIDTNGNGNQDTGEPDLADVDVVITDSAGNTQTVSTDADGNWTADVPPGTTTADVDETDPDFPVNHTQTEGTDPTTVTAVSSTNTDAGIDGYAPPAGTVSGHLYIDTNGNGTQDADEPDLADVDVIVTDSAGNPQTVTTDANGDWSATVPPGTTTADVDETDPDFPTDYTQTEGDDPTTVTAVSSTNTDAGIDGYAPPGTVSGHLYIDTNGNGTQDAGEPDLADVNVVITDSAGNQQTVSSDADGNWSASVPPGTTTADVDETDPDFPADHTQTEGTDPTTVTAVSSANTDAGIDGYAPPEGTVSGHLYIDTNGNGTQDSGEPDLADVDVIVTNSAGNTQTVATDANGDWSASVPPGTTTADVDETDPDFPAGYTQTEGDDPTTVTAVSSTNTDAGIDGYAPPGTVSGHLYIDTNGNGTQDAGEPNLADVDVIITDSTGNSQTVSSDANGNWSASVPPGTTTADVDETDPEYPAGYTQTEGDDPTTVTAVAGADTDAGNDGYYLPGSVSGHLYLDTNGNGVQDAGEPDLANVDVIVTDSNGNQQTVSSDTSGNWSASVPPGTTTADVDENDPEYPAGYTQTEGDDPTTVTAVAGTDTSAGNDGYYLPGTVSGHLYIDTNANGMQDAGEPDLANVDVIVTDSNGNQQTVSSDASGNWSASVPPGTTTADVDENDPEYPVNHTQTEGDDPTTVTAVAGANTSAGNDGYAPPPGTVSGHLYIDSNGNGMQDAGEPNLVDVNVIITDSAGNSQTVSTDADGNWTATVPPGTTTADVDENDPQYPTGYTQTEGDDPTMVTAISEQDVSAGNDGYYLPGTVSGHLYLDTNANGMQDAGEPDLANVDVIITDSNGNAQTVPSDGNGNWSATVPPGTTTADVDENDPEYPTGYFQTEGDDPTTVIAVAGADTSAGNDGYALVADLAIDKFDNNVNAVAGLDYTYTVNVTNNGPSNSSGSTVVDTLPAGTSFVSSTGGCVDNGDSTVTCAIGALAVTAMVQFDITVHVNPDVTGQIVNFVSVSGNEPDPNPDNNNDSEPTDVDTQIDLTIDKAFSSNAVAEGSEGNTFTLVVGNNGPSNAIGVHVTDMVDSLLAVTNVDPQPQCAASTGQNIDCTFDIAAGGSVQVTVTYTAVPLMAPDPTVEDGSSFRFIFVNGYVLEGNTNGTGHKNDYFFDPDGDGPEAGFTMHLSCSDSFTGGWGEKDGPTLEDNPNWQISSYSIIRYKKGDIHKTCGEQVLPYSIDNTGTATGSDSFGEQTVSDDATIDVLGSAINPQLNVIKTGPALTTPGETIEFQIEVTYEPGSGPLEAENVAVDDPLCNATLTYVGGDDGDGKLDDDETWLYTCTYLVQGNEVTPIASTPADSGVAAEGSDYEFIFFNTATGEYLTVTGTTRGTDKKNEAYIAELDFTVHVSCSDTFPGGIAEKDDPTADSEWRVASYAIAKYDKNGQPKNGCGDNPLPQQSAVVNVATATATAAGFDLEASGGATVPIDGGTLPPGVCEVSGETQLKFGSDEAKWKITNNGNNDLVIASVTVMWPASNGDLKEVKLGGDVIHKGDFAPTSAEINSGWEGNADKRTIKDGDTEELKLKFKDDASETEPYSIVVVFEQGCTVQIDYEPGEAGGTFACAKPLDALTMVWDGANPVTIKAWKDTPGEILLYETPTGTSIVVGGDVTVSGYAPKDGNDVVWEVFDAANGSKLGESVFHMSCSDDDMDGETDDNAFPNDCGKREGNGKGGSGLNDWLLAGMVDSQGALVCTQPLAAASADEAPAEVVEVMDVEQPSDTDNTSSQNSVFLPAVMR